MCETKTELFIHPARLGTTALKRNQTAPIISSYYFCSDFPSTFLEGAPLRTIPSKMKFKYAIFI